VQVTAIIAVITVLTYSTVPLYTIEYSENSVVAETVLITMLLKSRAKLYNIEHSRFASLPAFMYI
jgi:hypothetical protein